MSYNTDYLKFLIDLRRSHAWYKRERKVLYYRKLLTYAFFIICKALTIQQIRQIVFCDNDNIVRKELALFVKNGDVRSENFKYCGRFSTYSVTKKGREWLADQVELLSMEHPSEINAQVIQEQFKIHQKDKLSNHLICTNQFLISMLCAATSPLDISVFMEHAFSLGNAAAVTTPKTKDQIVSDLSVFHRDLVICVEADTMQVKFSAPRGPAEKVSKYAMLFQNSNLNLPLHIFFSIQKEVSPERSSLHFTEQELHVLKNTEKVNSSATAIRLIRELLNFSGDSNIGKIEDVLHYLKEAAPQLSEQLLHTSLLKNTSVLLNCLIKHGYDQLDCNQIRTGINQLQQLIRQDTSKYVLKTVHFAEEKRKEELFLFVNGAGYQKQALLNGMSLSCCSADLLSYALPSIIPNLYFSPSEIMEIAKYRGLIEPEMANPILYMSSIPNSKWYKNASTDYVLHNVYCYTDKNNHLSYLCIENISDDIGGFLRVNAYLAEPANLHEKLQLIALVRDDYQLADGSILSTQPEWMNLENQRKRRIRFFKYSDFPVTITGGIPMSDPFKLDCPYS